MKYHSCSLVCAFLVLSASAAGQTTTATTSQNGAPARLPIPDIPGKTFDLAWVGKIVRVADPQISPNGKSLVTVVTKPDYERDLNLSELALVDIASGKTRFLTHGRKTASFPRWSPDGDRAAFLAADGDKRNQIFVLDMAGGDALQVTASPTSVQQFAWKPVDRHSPTQPRMKLPRRPGQISLTMRLKSATAAFWIRKRLCRRISGWCLRPAVWPSG